MPRLIQRNIYLTPPQQQRIEALAVKQGLAQADLIRKLIDIALPFAETGEGVDFGRLVTLIEFTSLALDVLIHRVSPADADPLLERALQYARQYHAPKG